MNKKYPNSVWSIDFDYGTVGTLTMEFLNCVRCVRDIK